jgi:rubrerythrin
MTDYPGIRPGFIKEVRMPGIDTGTKTLQSLLRGELSAVETYRQALEKVRGEDGALDLQGIERDHLTACDRLRADIVKANDKPSTSSGAWGAFAKAVEGTAKLFGNAAALKALKEGEEHGVSEYEQALKDESLDPQARRLISETLLPQQRTHISTLDRLIARARG